MVLIFRRGYSLTFSENKIDLSFIRLILKITQEILILTADDKSTPLFT